MAEQSFDGLLKHHEPSKLGTKEHWDQEYQQELENGIGQDEEVDVTSLDSWFAEVDAPMRIVEYLTSDDFPLSPNNDNRQIEKPTVLDLGCGNGSTLFELRIDGEFLSPMTGVDYSQQSVDLARKLWSKHCAQQEDENSEDEISFEQMDFMKEEPHEKPWWPEGGFDLVLDKGTFDAVSLSGETIQLDDKEVRLVESYPKKAMDMLKPGGYFFITSVNWTEEELIRWFTKGRSIDGGLKFYGKVNYPVYDYGGQTGQALASVCFRKAS